MGLQTRPACHHPYSDGRLPSLAPVTTFHDIRSDYGKRVNARYVAIEAVAGKEWTYRCDDVRPALFEVGFTGAVCLDGKDLDFEVARVWKAIGRQQCAVKWSDGIETRITQAQLRALLDKCAPVPTVGLKPTVLYPALFAPFEYAAVIMRLDYERDVFPELTAQERAHCKFLDFMERLERQLPLTDDERAVTMKEIDWTDGELPSLQAQEILLAV